MPVAAETILFVFEEEAKAKRFMERIAHYLIDVAMFRDGCDVYVIDGAGRTQHGEIYRLARMSSAQFSIKIDVEPDT